MVVDVSLVGVVLVVVMVVVVVVVMVMLVVMLVYGTSGVVVGEGLEEEIPAI